MDLDAPKITDWLSVLIMLLLVVLNFLVWRVNKRLTWLTGALESHSTWILRIEAMRGVNGKPLKVIWWDPNREKPPFKGAHGIEAQPDDLYLYLPPQYRSCPRGLWARTKEWFTRP